MTVAVDTDLALELRGVSKQYPGTDTAAVSGVDLQIRRGEFVTFLGPSGSGKTTTLNMIAGFISPTAGEIVLHGRNIADLPPHQRNLGMVFQNYALFPHMSVWDNVAFPLVERKYPKDQIRERVRAALEMVNLTGFEKRRPRELSGGQQQRVALTRALVFDPPILLMDEPLSALDKKLRQRLQLEIKRVHREVGITFLFVTHDQEEAMALSDRVVVFDQGRIEQVGTPDELYRSARDAVRRGVPRRQQPDQGEARRAGRRHRPGDPGVPDPAAGLAGRQASPVRGRALRDVPAGGRQGPPRRRRGSGLPGHRARGRLPRFRAAGDRHDGDRPRRDRADGR
ncbi:ABC transporter ATP-binding protein [Nonomuraea ferruginea]